MCSPTRSTPWDLHTTATTRTATVTDGGPTASVDLRPGRPTTPDRPRGQAEGRGPVFHLHLHTDALTALRSPTGPDAATAGAMGAGVVRVDRLGARSTETLRQWLEVVAPGVVVKVTPVVDLTTRIGVGGVRVPV